MERIDSLPAYIDLVNNYISNNTYTNNYLLPGKVEEIIKTGQLYFVEQGSNLVILHDRQEFGQLYFHLRNLNDYIAIKNHSPLVMEIVFRGEKQSIQQVQNYWCLIGFKPHIMRINMQTAINEVIFLNKSSVSEIAIKIADLQIESDFVFNLTLQSFDKYTGDVLTKSQSDELVQNCSVICAYYQHNLAGFLHFEIKSGVAWIGHIAVSPEYGGKGIGKALVNEYLKLNFENGIKRFQLWVIADNHKAVSMYKGFGFKFANKSTLSMIKNSN